jgi:hypothetical protein
MGFFFEEIFHFAKTTEFSLSLPKGTAIVLFVFRKPSGSTEATTSAAAWLSTGINE